MWWFHNSVKFVCIMVQIWAIYPQNRYIFLKFININIHNAVVTGALYIVTMDILCQVMHTDMLTASDSLGNVNKSNFRNCKHGQVDNVAAISAILEFSPSFSWVMLFLLKWSRGWEQWYGDWSDQCTENVRGLEIPPDTCWWLGKL